MDNRLHKSSTSHVIAGVCGGLAEYFGVDATFVRLLFVILAIFHGVGILAYIVLWIIMPRESSLDLHPRDVVRENINNIRGEAERFGEQFRGSSAAQSATSEAEAPGEGESTQLIVPPAEARRLDTEPRTIANRQLIGGLVLLVLGVLFLMDNLRIFWWFSWGQMWPIVLIIIGAFLIYDRNRPRG